jgi:hypothetical protein
VRPEPFDPRCVYTLLRMVLYRAVYDWVLYRCSASKAKRKEGAQAYRWLFMSEDAPLTLELLCELMDMDVAKVRLWARRMTVMDMAVLYRGGRPRDPSMAVRTLRRARRDTDDEDE